MTTKQSLVGLLSAALAAAGIMAAASGCKMLKKETEESAADTAAAEPEPPPEPEPTAEATSEATAEASAEASADEEDLGDDEVKEYPQQIPASGTFILRKSFNIYKEADVESKRLGGAGNGTIVRRKATLGQWWLIKWPAAPGEMKPGWIRIPNQSRSLYIDETREPVDAGVPVVVDAGKKEEPKRPTLVKPRIPFSTKKKK